MATLKLQNNIDIVAENNEQGTECAINILTTNTCYSQSNEKMKRLPKIMVLTLIKYPRQIMCLQKTTILIEVWIYHTITKRSKK